PPCAWPCGSFPAPRRSRPGRHPATGSLAGCYHRQSSRWCNYRRPSSSRNLSPRCWRSRPASTTSKPLSRFACYSLPPLGVCSSSIRTHHGGRRPLRSLAFKTVIQFLGVAEGSERLGLVEWNLDPGGDGGAVGDV